MSLIARGLVLLGCVGAVAGVGRGFGSPALSDSVLLLGWGHLLGAALGDARRVQRSAPVVSARLAAACGLALFCTATALLSPLVWHSLGVTFLLVGVFVHVFENEWREPGSHLLGAPGAEACATALAPTFALGALAVRALEPAERALVALPEGLDLVLGTAALLSLAGAWRTARAPACLTMVLLVVSFATPLPRVVSAGEVVAVATLHHFAGWIVRVLRGSGRLDSLALRTAGRRLLLCHVPPVALFLAALAWELHLLRDVLGSPAIFLVGSFVHGVHTSVVRWATAPISPRGLAWTS